MPSPDGYIELLPSNWSVISNVPLFPNIIILYSLFKVLSIEKVIFLLTLYTFNKAEIHYRSRLELATSPVGVLP